MTNEQQIEHLVEKVQVNAKYAHISQDFIRRISAEVLQKGFEGKSAVKAVRNKLHQVGGAYFRRNVDYDALGDELTKLPGDIHSDIVRAFCRRIMGAHASTAERLPILDSFFSTCLAPIAPVTSILDLACGLTPLSLPWIPLKDGCAYTACDIYRDMLEFIEYFFAHFHRDGTAQPCDLLGDIPEETAQVAFLLKTIPCLEQVEKNIGIKLLDGLQTRHILVSFPAKSLSGRRKGMPTFYRDHFYEMIASKPWQVQEFEFSSEIAFLVTK